MRRIVSVLVLGLMLTAGLSAKDFEKFPMYSKWLGNGEVIFSYDGTFADSGAFVYNVRKNKSRKGSAPEKYADFPVHPDGAVNMTYSPDSTKIAFTRDNDLYVVDIATKRETRLTFDGTDLILNGYASWVYYEEILGRPSKYRAFWWSPDSRKIGFYRFDNTEVPLFPIYSPFTSEDGNIGGSLRETRYPKAGQNNPKVRIGIVDLKKTFAGSYSSERTVWADFDENEDQYFGIPFWSPDSQNFYVARMPRLQNTIDLYALNIVTGKKVPVYHESYPTWLNWFEGVEFTDKGLYMARSFETGWEQIYFLSYNGITFKRLTEGENWNIEIERVDETAGVVYFTAKRDATVRRALYKVDTEGNITALTDPQYNVQNVNFSPDGKYFTAVYSNSETPYRHAIFETDKAVASEGIVVADMAGRSFRKENYCLGQLVYMTTSDGFILPGMIVYPKNFDPQKKYPVHVDIYGGPDNPLVRDRWVDPERYKFFTDNGIIQITVDPRDAGHNGRAGEDMVYRQLTKWEIRDYVAWAEYLKALPYVDDDKIGVEGFSFGGTMTAMLVLQAPEHFHYGIAGGGVYDWALYDSHYTERFMDTPRNNPEGYALSRTINYADKYLTKYSGAADEGSAGVSDGSAGVEPVMLKLTHGTGDDNVHYQNTLLLIDALQRQNAKFEFMLYPDGMHGYRGYQGEHFQKANEAFWSKYLLGK